MHHVLEAKLVTANGFSLSLASVFIENPSAGATKQDCELKAFKRLAELLAADFPRLPLLLLLDAIYANKPLFDICASHHWDYIVTFKEGNRSALFDEFERLLALVPENDRTSVRPGAPPQRFRWVGPFPDGEHSLWGFSCEEPSSKKPGETSQFVWVTNLAVGPDNVEPMANQGGRLRWTIENEGFNIQKTSGYEMEHAYSEDETGLKNFYLLLQIAHICMQLVERGSLLPEPQRCLGALKNLSRRFLDGLRYWFIPESALDLAAAAAIQIRFNDSS
jgi:hypothetical protein